MTNPTPKAYADRLTRLHELGAGEGVPSYVGRGADGFYRISEPLVSCGGVEDAVRYAITPVANDLAATLILEAQLWRVLREWAKNHTPSLCAQMDEDGLVSICRYLGYRDYYFIVGAQVLLEAADAVIKYLEDSRE